MIVAFIILFLGAVVIGLSLQAVYNLFMLWYHKRELKKAEEPDILYDMGLHETAVIRYYYRSVKRRWWP